jgi:4-amino-4-deoxy-L-arabinose transferase-like glycosyltransferase
MKSKEDTGTRPLWREPLSALLALGILSAAGFCLRLYRIGEPLFDFSPVRQYHSALLARGFYEWLLTGNLETLPPDGVIEPPILELLASLTYAIIGGEHLWIPRLMSAVFWTVGGVFLYLVARKMVSPTASLFAVAFYLLDPAVVLPSRAFMPDPLMIMLLVMSVYSVVGYHEQGRLNPRSLCLEDSEACPGAAVAFDPLDVRDLAELAYLSLVGCRIRVSVQVQVERRGPGV